MDANTRSLKLQELIIGLGKLYSKIVVPESRDIFFSTNLNVHAFYPMNFNHDLALYIHGDTEKSTDDLASISMSLVDYKKLSKDIATKRDTVLEESIIQHIIDPSEPVISEYDAVLLQKNIDNYLKLRHDDMSFIKKRAGDKNELR